MVVGTRNHLDLLLVVTDWALRAAGGELHVQRGAERWLGDRRGAAGHPNGPGYWRKGRAVRCGAVQLDRKSGARGSAAASLSCVTGGVGSCKALPPGPRARRWFGP